MLSDLGLKWSRALAARVKRHKPYRPLECLDDRLLRDIGMCRTDLTHVRDYPFRRPRQQNAAALRAGSATRRNGDV